MKLMMISSLLYDRNGNICWPAAVAALVIIFYILAHINVMVSAKRDKLGYESRYYKVLSDKTAADTMISRTEGIDICLKFIGSLINYEISFSNIEHELLNQPYNVAKLPEHEEELAKHIKNSLGRAYIDNLVELGMTEDALYSYIVADVHQALLTSYQAVNSNIVLKNNTDGQE